MAPLASPLGGIGMLSSPGIAGSISKQAIGLKYQEFVTTGLSVPKIPSPKMKGSYLKGSEINRKKNKTIQEKTSMFNFKQSAFEDNNLTFNIKRVLNEDKKKMKSIISKTGIGSVFPTSTIQHNSGYQGYTLNTDERELDSSSPSKQHLSFARKNSNLKT